MNPDLRNPEEARGLLEALKRRSVGQAIWWMVATIVALAAWDLFPAEAIDIAFAYVLVTAALAIWAATRGLVVAYPRWHRTDFDAAFERRPTSSPMPEELERIQHAVSFSRFSAYDAHGRLRPLVREIANAFFAMHYGRDVDTDLERSQASLAPPLWEAIRPRDGLPDRAAPGVSLLELERIVSALEELAQR